MTLDTWLTFTVMELFVCLMPGPAVLFVTTTAAERGARAAFVGTCGIQISNIMYFVISGTGVAAVLLAAPTLFTVLRWTGSAYLLYLGGRMLLSTAARKASREQAATPVGTNRRSVLHGFMVQTLNPKAIAYFVALLPQFIDPTAAVAPQLSILIATSLLVETGTMSFYIWLTLRFGRKTGTQGKVWLKRLAGAFLILVATRLAIFG